jgi:hypothetical protein
MSQTPTPTGRAGSQITADREGKVPHSDRTSRNIPVADLPEHPATVGISMSVGFNTEFGRDKGEVVAWCTLPCHPDPDSRRRAYDEAAADVLEQLGVRLDQLMNHYFPDLVGKEGQ